MRFRLIAVALVVAVATLPGCTSSSDPSVMDDCVRADLEGRSVARVWDEALLDAIRRDVPAPTVHARNLFHVSAAMWDAWAAYDPAAEGYFIDDKLEADDVQAAREEAISFAAYRILLWRYSKAAGLQETFDELVNTMESLCYRIDFAGTDGDSPAALGNRIAAAIIEFGKEDGSLEQLRYVDTTYRPVNAPLVVAESNADMLDPNRWQPLALAQFVAQNGLPIPGNVQRFVGPHWGHLRAFALPASPQGLPIDPGPPPLLGEATDEDFKQTAVEVIRYSSELDPNDGATIDISPGALGDNALGTNDGDGHDVNPATGSPYEPNVVLRGDFTRVLAQFWADGPASETPPGHWNTIANEVSDSPGFELPDRWRGPGGGPSRVGREALLRTERRRARCGRRGLGREGALRLGATHLDDPIHGEQGTVDRSRWSVLRPGWPSARPGTHRGDHRALERARWTARGTRRPRERDRDHAWKGNPLDPATTTSGAGWILSTDWVPYQLATFVTPAFAGYVSGHSTFSRAAAEVMTAFTGSEYFPGGLSEWTVPADSLAVDRGPSQDVTLQWATYYDAADQAGLSRLFGGIHISPDDFEGRKIGSICGMDAWALAQGYFAGTAA